jgi:hypothetical protein
MSDTSSGKTQTNAKKSAKRDATRASEGVLANLPRTRPQRPSARRDASRKAAQAKATPQKAAQAKTTPRKAAQAKATPRQAAEVKATPQKAAQAKARPTRAKSQAKPLHDPAPRQGFESESAPISGSVRPPGGVELLASAAELAGELTKTGLSTGGRLLKDVLSRLPLN